MMDRTKRNIGFTLVELMVAIVIIGILMAIAVPAVMRVVRSGRETAMRLEINALEQAVEQYFQKYDDYPPDGSSWQSLNRHMRRLFPRMADPDTSLLWQLTHDANDSFSAVAMDRAEALVFFLGGFSDNPLHPLTGEGGPLVYVGGTDGDASNIVYYDYNPTRDNAFFDFDARRLTIRREAVGGVERLLSHDEATLGTDNAQHAPRHQPLDFRDQLPVYLADTSNPTPFVYFDSRTYGNVGTTSNPLFNGYRPGPSEYGALRPYMTARFAGPNSGFGDYKFHNPDTFQIIAPGLDGIYGSVVDDTGGQPVYFATETGMAVGPGSPPAIRGFQETSLGVMINGHLDNITNFSNTTLENDLE